MASIPSSIRRARRQVIEQAASAAQIPMTVDQQKREILNRILRAVVAPPDAWGAIRGAFRHLSLDQLERIAAICTEKR